MRPSIVASASVPAVLALVAGFGCAHAACPASAYFYGGLEPATPITIVAASNDTVFSIHGCDRVHGRFQVNAGLLIASIDHACGLDAGAGASGLETVLEDDFTVSGLPGGTPVSFDAVLELEGSAASFSEPGTGGGGRVRGLVREGASNEVSVMRATAGPALPSISVDESLTLPVSAVVGAPVHLRFSVRGEAIDGAAQLVGTFRFANLPTGASVQSCRGYSSSAPVPARASTWGGLKSRYR